MNKKTWSFFIVTVLLIVMTSLSAMKGSLEVGIVDLVQGIFTGANEDVEVIKDLRFPRIIIALFTGEALAVSGVLFQAVMKNPLADAGVIGISSGASFMTLVIITLFPQFFFWTPVFAFFRWCVCVLSRLCLFMEVRVKSTSYYFSWYSY